VDAGKNQLEMTFRSTDHPSSSGKLQLSDLIEGQKIRGFVKKVEDYGLFIQLDDSKLSGLCHKSEVCGVNAFRVPYRPSISFRTTLKQT
jgi:rRNA biogenesis protein RRP5